MIVWDASSYSWMHWWVPDITLEGDLSFSSRREDCRTLKMSELPLACRNLARKDNSAIGFI